MSHNDQLVLDLLRTVHGAGRFYFRSVANTNEEPLRVTAQKMAAGQYEALRIKPSTNNTQDETYSYCSSTGAEKTAGKNWGERREGENCMSARRMFRNALYVVGASFAKAIECLPLQRALSDEVA